MKNNIIMMIFVLLVGCNSQKESQTLANDAPVVEPEENDTTNWEYIEDVDPINDRVTGSLVANCANHSGVRFCGVIIGCQNEYSYSVLITLGEYIGNQATSALVRHDQNNAITYSLDPASGSGGLAAFVRFSQRDHFLAQMSTASTMIIRIRNYDSTFSTETIPVEGFSEASRQLPCLSRLDL